MSTRPCITRFAPSPSGALHAGNARTALFNDLAARASGGRLVLRIEDTDAGRSDERLVGRLIEDLRWLGIEWAEGPDVGGPHAPYRQSERATEHARAVAALEERGLAYPCFCTEEELRLSRKAQLAAGRPPRYAGTCAVLSGAEVARRLASGARPASRFRVPEGRVVEFDDLIHARQRFATSDIGDFVIRRSDGSAAFFLSNAVDDAAMEVSLVLRGDDHLANTPRQILLLEALGLPVPRYGHLPLLLGPSGTPLSKREGAASLRDLRERGYLPDALRNYLVRLGHACGETAWLARDELPGHFDPARTSRSAAHFDEVQLKYWQREAIAHATTSELRDWLAGRLDRLGGVERQDAFLAVVRGNLLFPSDADVWVDVVCNAAVVPDAAAGLEIARAGCEFFERAATAWRHLGPDFRAWTRAVAADTSRTGAALYMPLRGAVTGLTHGPEFAPLVALIGTARVAERIVSAGARAAGGTDSSS